MNWRLVPWDYLTRLAGVSAGVLVVSLGTPTHDGLEVVVGGLLGGVSAALGKQQILREIARRKAAKP